MPAMLRDTPVGVAVARLDVPQSVTTLNDRCLAKSVDERGQSGSKGGEPRDRFPSPVCSYARVSL